MMPQKMRQKNQDRAAEEITSASRKAAANGNRAAKNGRAARLRVDPCNARIHPEENKAMIRASLKEVGAFRSIAVDGQGIVRAGNGVFEVAQDLGLKVRVIDAKPDELVAVRRPDLKGRKAIRAGLLDNRTGELSEWDPKVLTQLKASRLLEGLDMAEFLNRNGQEVPESKTLLDQAVQLHPPCEYVVVMCADDDGAEFSQLRSKLGLKEVRRGGYKRGSQFDDVGVERVIHAKDLLKRLG